MLAFHMPELYETYLSIFIDLTELLYSLQICRKGGIRTFQKNRGLQEIICYHRQIFVELK